jgi:predicted PurR-regulated permease PerM
VTDVPLEAVPPAARLSHPPEPVPPRLSVTRVTVQVLAILLATLAILWALQRLQSVLLLLTLAVFFAYLLAPLVSLLRARLVIRGRPLPLPLAIGIVYLVLFGALACVVALLLPVVSDQFAALSLESPSYLAKAQAKLQLWQRYEQSHFPRAVREAVDGAANHGLMAAGDWVQKGLLPFLGTVVAHLPWLVLVPILAFFLLKDAEVFRRSALRAFPRGRLRWRGDDFFQDVNQTLASYVRAQLIACLIVGAACSVGFAVIGVPYAVVLGIAAGLVEFVPLAGPVTIAVVAVAFAAFHSGGQALVTAIFLALLRIVQDYVIYPRIIGSGIHLHPLAIILAILCGAELGGLAGIFLSIPIVAVVSVAFRHWREHRAEDAELAAP